MNMRYGRLFSTLVEVIPFDMHYWWFALYFPHICGGCSTTEDFAQGLVMFFLTSVGVIHWIALPVQFSMDFPHTSGGCPARTLFLTPRESIAHTCGGCPSSIASAIPTI